MISGIVPFEEIVQSIKDETGIENLRPLYEKIKRLIFRAERDIGYGGSVELKKRTYRINTDYNGKFFTFPEDFIEFEGIGQKGFHLRNSNHTTNTDLLRFATVQKENTVLLYWGINTDKEGYPKVTRNHEEAVVAFVVWKLYTSKIFLGIGNMNANKNYQQEYEVLCLASRGNDAFPTLEQWDDIGALSYTDRRIMIEEPTHNYDYSEDVLESGTNGTVTDTTLKVYYWQLEDLSETLESITPNFANTTYLFSKPKVDYSDFEQGQKIIYTKIAKIAFAIHKTEQTDFGINDSLNNDITDEFDTYYSQAIKAFVFVSKTHRSHSTLYFKFKKL